MGRGGGRRGGVKYQRAQTVATLQPRNRRQCKKKRERKEGDENKAGKNRKALIGMKSCIIKGKLTHKEVNKEVNNANT